jgi:hypothetical protein
MIAAVSGATPKDNKKSRRKPPLKDHETWPKEKRRAWMLGNFKLSTIPVLNTPQKVDRAVEFLDGYWDLYSFDGSFDKTNLIAHQIYTEDVPPIKTRHRPINPGQEKNLREQLDKWIEHDVIEPSSSPWSFFFSRGVLRYFTQTWRNNSFRCLLRRLPRSQDVGHLCLRYCKFFNPFYNLNCSARERAP